MLRSGNGVIHLSLSQLLASFMKLASGECVIIFDVFLFQDNSISFSPVKIFHFSKVPRWTCLTKHVLQVLSSADFKKWMASSSVSWGMASVTGTVSCRK